MKQLKPSIQKQVKKIDDEIARIDPSKYVWNYTIDKLYARRTALLLIGYNIAHRGKKLHQATIIRRAKKLGADGEYILDKLQNPTGTRFYASDLHAILATEFNVTLLDAQQLKHLMNLRHDRYGYNPKYLVRMGNYNQLIDLHHKKLIQDYEDTENAKLIWNHMGRKR